VTLADAAWFAPQSKKRITPYQGGSASFYIGCCCYCCLASFCETSWVSEHLLGISLVHLVARVVSRYRHGGDFCNLHADQCPAGYGAKRGQTAQWVFAQPQNMPTGGKPGEISIEDIIYWLVVSNMNFISIINMGYH
jgi:hypothetical protein